MKPEEHGEKATTTMKNFPLIPMKVKSTDGISADRNNLKKEISSVLDEYDQVQTLSDISDHLNDLMERTLGVRFTRDAKVAFDNLFHLIGKKFANVIRSVTVDGKVLFGAMMEKAVMKKFEDDHRDNDYKGNGRIFPVLPEKILEEWRKIMYDIAITGGFSSGAAFDAITKETFKCVCNVGKAKCEPCLRKAKNISNIAEHGFWSSLSDKALRQTLMVKLMPLNKGKDPHP